MKLKVPSYISKIKPYRSGKPLEELEREYGISDSIKIASNENPLGPSPLAMQAIQSALPDLHRYPDSSGFILIEKLSATLGISPDKIVLGNGSDEIIGMLTQALLQKGDEAIVPQPSFLMYEIMVRCCGAVPVFVPLKSYHVDLDATAEKITSRTRMIFICNPNNPTGTIISKTDFSAFLNAIPPEIVVVVDEAYIEFVRDPDCVRGIDYLESDRSIASLRTFSKAYGLAGLRIGYGLMPPPLAELLNRIRHPFNVNSLALAAAASALDDVEFLKKTQQTIHEGLDFLHDALDTLKIRHFPTQANFFMIDTKRSADDVFELMLHEGVIVRSMTSYGYPEYIRINVGLPYENARFVKALAKVLS